MSCLLHHSSDPHSHTPAYIFNKQGALLFLIVISLMIYFLNNRTAKLLDTGCNWINTHEMGRFRGISERGEHVDFLKHLALPPFTLCNQLFCSPQHNQGYSFKRKTTLPHTNVNHCLYLLLLIFPSLFRGPYQDQLQHCIANKTCNILKLQPDFLCWKRKNGAVDISALQTAIRFSVFMQMTHQTVVSTLLSLSCL